MRGFCLDRPVALVRHIEGIFPESVRAVHKGQIVVTTQHFGGTVCLKQSHVDVVETTIRPVIVERVIVGILECETAQCKIAQRIAKRVTRLSRRAVEGRRVCAHAEVSVGHDGVVHIEQLFLALMQLIAKRDRCLSSRRHIAHTYFDHRDIRIRGFGRSPGC